MQCPTPRIVTIPAFAYAAAISCWSCSLVASLSSPRRKRTGGAKDRRFVVQSKPSRSAIACIAFDATAPGRHAGSGLFESQRAAGHSLMPSVISDE